MVLLKKKDHSIPELSRHSDVPTSYINYGRTLLAKAEPHIIKMVDEGKINVRAALPDAAVAWAQTLRQRARWSTVPLTRAPRPYSSFLTAAADRSRSS